MLLRAERILSYIGEDKAHEVIATTIIAFAISTVLTGVVFILLGVFKVYITRRLDVWLDITVEI